MRRIPVQQLFAMGIFCLVAIVALLPLRQARAAELGRFPVNDKSGKDVPPGAAPVEIEHAYRGAISGEMGPGIDIGLGWNAMRWKVGGESYRDQAFTPQASVFYSIGKHFDFRATGRYYQMKDDEFGLKVGRLGVGPRGWLGLGEDFFGYAGVLFNYYYFYCDEGSHEQGTIGLSGEAGVAYLISDYVLLLVGVQAETTVADGKVDINDQTENLTMNGVGLNLGVMITF
ncbi:MAG: hypothetical protein KKG09_10760 [Verrucomicrobia bacterium]|nr:hypothetical protein [Verrucomicrobiota bacterium]MBU4292130.1 hypothetical protein [Verrucomicrobiota bacterium]MBU4428927.1 hypothetical protein [Verrucomicrobiota bacterium]MBU4498473.1 hypothetical protein [Verrucomicrobiota bacterium]MCG2680800.1 hypothetical protein [Kiritimatiellia bacterium]